MSSSAWTSATVKDVNTRLVRSALRDARSATVKDLALTTGLSAVTVGTLVQALVDQGVAREGVLRPSQGGRPSREYHFEAQHALVLVAFTREVEGRDTLCLRVADLYGEVLASEDQPLDATSLAALEPGLDRLVERYPRVRVIGLGLPGIEHNGTIVALDYPGLVGTPIVDHFQRRYDRPVLFENDVNAAVMGRRPGAASEVYLYFPRKYGPGAGIRLDGRLWKGSRHYAGEVSFLPLGVAWGGPWTDDFASCVDTVARVVLSLAAVLDPDSVVLFGEFLTEAHREAVAARCQTALPGLVPSLSLADDFTRDVQQGLIQLTLGRLEPRGNE